MTKDESKIITNIVREVISKSIHKKDSQYATYTQIEGFPWLVIGEPLVTGHGEEQVYAGRRVYLDAGAETIRIGEIRRGGAIAYWPIIRGGFDWISNFKGDDNKAAIAIWNKLEKKQGNFNGKEMLAVRSKPNKSTMISWVIFDRNGVTGYFLSDGDIYSKAKKNILTKYNAPISANDAESAMEILSTIK